MEKILFDTDIGSDIDDAACLAYLLKQPECDLLGITTVSGEPVKRAMIASALCKVAGKDIPIYPGVEQPLHVKPYQPKAPQSAKLENWPHETSFPEYEAIEFMRRTIRENPGEVTLLAVGPLTNVALLFSIDPEIPTLLKQLVLMCGVFTNALAGVGPVEWNAICDPHATSIVYNAPVKRSISIGLDVTCQLKMDMNEVRKDFQSEMLKPVASFAEVWFEHTPELTFHDPLAATVIFDSEICGYQQGNITVELLSERLKGLTYWKSDENGKHLFADQVDRKRFFDHYFQTVNA